MHYRQMMIKTLMSAGLLVTSSGFAADADQAAINALQKQIQTSNQQWHQALETQQATTQKAISGMQTQVQGQIQKIEQQMQQMQTQLTAEIKQVQAEVVKMNAGQAAAGKKAP